MTTSDWAASYAEALLAPLGDRWLHAQGVARQAQHVAPILPASEREALVAAAYLHDLGYAPTLVQTGLHPLDGARHLRALGHERLAGLVAYHSGARAEAEFRGLAAERAQVAGAVEVMPADLDQGRGVAEVVHVGSSNQGISIDGRQDGGQPLRLPGDPLHVKPAVTERR